MIVKVRAKSQKGKEVLRIFSKDLRPSKSAGVRVTPVLVESKRAYGFDLLVEVKGWMAKRLYSDEQRVDVLRKGQVLKVNKVMHEKDCKPIIDYTVEVVDEEKKD